LVPRSVGLSVELGPPPRRTTRQKCPCHGPSLRCASNTKGERSKLPDRRHCAEPASSELSSRSIWAHRELQWRGSVSDPQRCSDRPSGLRGREMATEVLVHLEHAHRLLTKDFSSFSSALICRRSLASCKSFFLMYSHIFLTTSLRGRSFSPTISASSAEGVTGAVMPPRAPPAGFPVAFTVFSAASGCLRIRTEGGEGPSRP
jgi:hypothetical protein